MERIFFLIVIILFSLKCYSNNTELTIKKEIIIKVFNIKWRTPFDANKMITPAKSSEGTITISNRTNQLIVSDYPDNIHKMTRILKKFDLLKRFEKTNKKGFSGQLSIKGKIKNKRGKVIMPFGFIAIDKHEVKREQLNQLNYHIKDEPKWKVHSKDTGMSIYVTPKILDTNKVYVNVCIVEKKIVGWTDQGEPVIDNYTEQLKGIITKNKTLKLIAKEYNRNKYYVEMTTHLNIDKKKDLSVSYY